MAFKMGHDWATDIIRVCIYIYIYIYMVTPPCMTYRCLSNSRWGPLADNKKVKKTPVVYGFRLKNNTVNH